MKKKVKVILPIILGTIIIAVIINYTLLEPNSINKYLATNLTGVPANQSFKDQNLYNCVVDAYNKQNKTSVAYTESLTDEQLQTITSLSCEEKGISDASGIEKLPSLTNLYLSENQLSSIDLSHTPNLTDLNLYKNQLSSIDLSHTPNLEHLYLRSNQLSSIDLSHTPNLTDLNLYKNQLSSIDLSHTLNLTHLDLRSNQLSSIDLSHTPNLEYLYLYDNQLSSIDLSHTPNLTNLSLSNNQLSSIDLSHTPNLKDLGLEENQLSSIDLSHTPNLEYLYLDNSHLSSIDLSHTPNLKKIDLSYNQLSSIDLSHTPNLEYLDLHKNQLSSIDLSHTPNLEKIDLSFNQLSSIDLSHTPNLKKVDLSFNQLSSIDLSNLTKLDILDLNSETYEISQYAYAGNEVSIKNPIKLPSHITSKPKYTSADETIATINNDKIQGLKAGNVDITGKEYRYSYKIHLKVFKLESEKYLINENNNTIYIGTDNINDINNNLSIDEVVTKELDTENNKLVLKYNNEILKEFNILRLDLGHYKASNKKIGIGENEVPYDSFTKEITPVGVTYKIFNNGQEVIGGDIGEGMTLKVYLEGEEIDSYEITKDYIYIDRMEIKNENMIYNLSAGTKVKDIKNNIYTNGEVKLYKGATELTETDKVGTGTKVIITLSNEVVEYEISIRGDTTGDGEVSISDVSKLYKYVKGKQEMTEVYKESARILNNDNITISNVSKLYKYIKGKESYL